MVFSGAALASVVELATTHPSVKVPIHDIVTRHGGSGVRSPSNSLRGIVEGMEDIQDESDLFTAKIEHDAKRCREHERAVHRIKREIEQVKMRLHATQKDFDAAAVSTLEGRVESAKQRNNEALRSNAALKSEIDELRRKQLRHSRLTSNLDAELVRWRRQLAALVTSGKTAFAEREEALHFVAKLEQQHAAAGAEFEKEWKSLGETLRLKEADLDATLARLQAKTPSISHGGNSKNVILQQVEAEESRLKKAVISNTWNTAKARISTKLFNDKVHTFEEAFKRIQSVTGVASLEELEEYMVQAEDRNFRAFNHLSDINNEVAELEAVVTSLATHIEDNQNQTMVCSQFKRQVIAELQDKHRAAVFESDALELACRDITDRLDAFKPHVRSIFNMLDCAVFPSAGSLDVNNMTNDEMLQSLGIIEQRLNEVLHMFNCIADVARVKAKALDSYQTFHSPELDLAALGADPNESPHGFVRRRRLSHASIGKTASMRSLGPGAGQAPNNKPPPRVHTPKSGRGPAILGPQTPRNTSSLTIDPPSMDLGSFDGGLELLDGGEHEQPIHREDLELQWLQATAELIEKGVGSH